MAKQKLPIIFKVGGGEVCAFFPTLPGTRDPHTCTCYAHVGQHGSASVAYAANMRAAKPAEYEPLLKELSGIYADCELVIKRKFHFGYVAIRRKALEGK